MRITQLTLLIEKLLATLPDEEEDDNKGVFPEEEQTLTLIAELRGELFEIDLETLRLNDANYGEFVGSLYEDMNVYLDLAEEIFMSRPSKVVETRFQKKLKEASGLLERGSVEDSKQAIEIINNLISEREIRLKEIEATGGYDRNLVVIFWSL